jgi:hypothetical protein
VEKQKRLQLALQQRELAEVKGKPVINSSSKGLRRDVTAMMEWQQERERKIAEKLAAKQAAEAAELQVCMVMTSSWCLCVSVMLRVHAARTRDIQTQREASRTV